MGGGLRERELGRGRERGGGPGRSRNGGEVKSEGGRRGEPWVGERGREEAAGEQDMRGQTGMRGQRRGRRGGSGRWDLRNGEQLLCMVRGAAHSPKMSSARGGHQALVPGWRLQPTARGPGSQCPIPLGAGLPHQGISSGKGD